MRLLPLGFLLMIVLGPMNAEAQVATVDLEAIVTIESGGNRFAYNKRSGATGKFQITQIALDDWNQYSHREHLELSDMYDPALAEEVASWLLTERYPAILRWIDEPVTLRNLLICYNAGCGYVSKELPQESVNYIKAYNKLTEVRI